MTSRRMLLCPMLLAAPFLLPAPPAGAAQDSPWPRLPDGAVVSLAGTPHLWVADREGVLHWVGDTRALARRTVRWETRTEVSRAQLRQAPRGDPWLSFALLKVGDPIYLVKWETSEPRPRLFHLLSLADLELFGIDSTNYGAHVLDRAAWEARYGMLALMPPGAAREPGGLAPR
jgi:hypothetical protein